MMKWLPVALALTVSACSNVPETHYYHLPVVAGNTEMSIQPYSRPIWVESVSVPDYLAGNGVVYQSNDVQYVIASNNLWASPLDQQLQQTLIGNLSAELPGAAVSSMPADSDQPQDTLNVTVTGFHGRYDGQVIISGTWTLAHNDQVYKRTFMLTLPQSEDGYDDLVRTLAQGWQQISTQIANVIIQQH